MKRVIYDKCIEILEARLAEINLAYENAREASIGEDKSSAGDKYETSRAMSHNDMARYHSQAAKTQEEIKSIRSLNPEQEYTLANQGSLVESTQGFLYISVGLGTIEIGKNKVIVISSQSPLALALKGKKAGESYQINSIKHTINRVI